MPHTPEDDPLHAAIAVRLAELVRDVPSVPSWYDAWMLLGPGSPEEERLAVYRSVRGSGDLPAEAGFYLVAWQLDVIAGLRAEHEQQELEERLEAIRCEHGLDEGDEWLPGEAPAEYERLLEESHAAWDRLYARTLEEFGEREIARLYRHDREEFERRFDAGRAFFHGPKDAAAGGMPPWLHELISHITEGVEATDVSASLGCRYRRDEEEGGAWEVLMYLRPVEIVGGAADGEVVTPGFTLDLQHVCSAFGRIDELKWDALGSPDGDGPQVSVEGLYGSEPVLLHIAARAPEDVEPGKSFDPTAIR